MKLSVAMCTYNGAQYIEEQLQSIHNQTVPISEIVISDDGSTDSTVPIIQEYAKQTPFPIRVLVNHDSLGVGQNFSRCIQECTGDLIFTCDQDDIWQPDKVEVFSRLFYQYPNCDLAFSDLTLISEDGKETGRNMWQDLGFISSKLDGSENAFEQLIQRNVVTGAAMVFRSSLAKIACPVPHGFIHDEWIALVASLTGTILTIKAPMVKYRIHQAQQIGSASGLLGEWRHARKLMNRNYFENRITRAQAIVQFIQTHKDILCNPRYIHWPSGILSHAHAVAAIHHSWLLRWPLIFRELITGRYFRYDHGLKSVIRDSLL